MSLMIRPDTGTKTRTANQVDVNKHIIELQQELTKSRAETQRARDKLNCLISLVRRSWNGDRNASIHLANIIGLDIPPALSNSGTDGRPASRIHTASSAKTVAEVNWERLTLKLLQRDYEQMQREIQQRQQHYIENRSRFMDEVLHFHKQDMARTPLSRPSSGKLSSVDQQFLQVHNMIRPDGTNTKRPALNRPKSLTVRMQHRIEPDMVQQAEVKLRDLFVQSSSLSSTTPAADASLAGTKEAEPVKQRHAHIRQDYDDAKRYKQGNLFKAENVLSKKPRPVSATMQREKDRLRARPKTAITFNMESTGKEESSGDKPLKYETTRPVLGKKLSSAQTRFFSSIDPSQHDTNGHNSEAAPNYVSPIPEQALEEQEDYREPAPEKAPISVHMKNAITHPECVDRFTEDLRNMEAMEAMFKMNTLALQKKLGIPENGIV